jgi:hypothetical protein
VEGGGLKVVAKGLPFPVPSGAATANVVLSLDGGTDTYCMTFSGTGDGNKFIVKDAAAGTCMPTQTCGNNVREGQEECDGTDDTNCVGACDSMCRCDIPGPGSCSIGGGGCPSPYGCVPVPPDFQTFCLWFGTCNAPYSHPSDFPMQCVHLCGPAPTCGGTCGIGQTCTDQGLADCACVNNP